MRGHKFICLVESSYFLEGEFEESVEEQIAFSDDAYMACLTLAHEKFWDNVIEIATESDPEDTYSFVRDLDGRLYYVDQAFSKQDVIRLFEQTD